MTVQRGRSKSVQEAEEREALDIFRAVSGLLPGEVTRVRLDPPDFLITGQAHPVAVEMTRYHHDSGSRGSQGAKRESLERRVMAAAQVYFEGLEPHVHVRVSPYFREGTLQKTNVR